MQRRAAICGRYRTRGRCEIPPETHFAITFRNPEDGSTTVLRARRVTDSDLGPSFVCISDFVFETGSRVLNPAEEALARKYEHTRRLHLNLFAIQAIAEIGGAPQALELEQDRSNLLVLPTVRPTSD